MSLKYEPHNLGSESEALLLILRLPRARQRQRQLLYRSTSLMRNSRQGYLAHKKQRTLGPYGKIIPRDLC